MKSTPDDAGRLIVPEALQSDLEVAATPMKLQKRGKGVVAVPRDDLPPLSAEQVRETLDRVRR